jgi:hypothetical protein
VVQFILKRNMMAARAILAIRIYHRSTRVLFVGEHPPTLPVNTPKTPILAPTSRSVATIKSQK